MGCCASSTTTTGKVNTAEKLENRHTELPPKKNSGSSQTVLPSIGVVAASNGNGKNCEVTHLSICPKEVSLPSQVVEKGVVEVEVAQPGIVKIDGLPPEEVEIVNPVLEPVVKKEDPPLLDLDKPLIICEHVRDAVLLWGDRGGVCQPQPLFDAISALITLDQEAQKVCGFHRASLHMGANARVARALVPLVESEVSEHLRREPGSLSLSARTPIDEKGLHKRVESFLKGDVRCTDRELLDAIHVQDVDWADVDNGIAVLTLGHCLKESGAKHRLHAFVSRRRMSAEFAPSILHTDDAGEPILAEGDKVQFRVTTTENLSAYEVKPSIVPYIKECDFECRTHDEQDMIDLGLFECAILKAQLTRFGLGKTSIYQSGTFESAGLSGNVHKLTWYLYAHDGSMRTPEAYFEDATKYFKEGIGQASERRKLFQEYIRPLQKVPPPGEYEDFFRYCREHPEDKIVVHCGGPLFLIRELAKQADLRERVILVGAMFLSYDGAANLLGCNFNEGVAPVLTEEVFGEDGSQFHRDFPNAHLVCIATETCKSRSLNFVPFENTLQHNAHDHDVKQMASLEAQRALDIDKGSNQPLLIMSDDGKDPDDELAKVLLGGLTQLGLTTCHGCIANLYPAKERARLARGTLDQLGLMALPAGVGFDLIEVSHSNYEFNAPYMGSLERCASNGVQMCVDILRRLDKGVSVTLVCLSGLTDAYTLLHEHRDLFKEKIARVVIMGGVELESEKVKLDADGYMMPDKAQNNLYDFPGAQKFYKELQRECIPMTIVTRWAAYAAKLPFVVYDELAATGHPVGNRLQQVQQHSLEHLWRRASLDADDSAREGLPARCDKSWFCKIFLNGRGEDRSGDDSIWDLASTFQAYDPMAVVAALHGVRARFMRPLLVEVEGSNGTISHEILGLSEVNHGIVQGVLLAEWLHSVLLKSLETCMGKIDSNAQEEQPSREPSNNTKDEAELVLPLPEVLERVRRSGSVKSTRSTKSDWSSASSTAYEVQNAVVGNAEDQCNIR
jgi:hypothetical protein